MKYEFKKLDEVQSRFPGRPKCQENTIIMEMIEKNEECVLFTYQDVDMARRGRINIGNYCSRKNLKTKVIGKGLEILVINEGVIK